MCVCVCVCVCACVCVYVCTSTDSTSNATKWHFRSCLLRAWFKSENHREPYYLGRSICQIDNLLLEQRPPSECSWPARSIRRHVQYWKACELHSWLPFYTLPLLLDFFIISPFCLCKTTYLFHDIYVKKIDGGCR